MFSRDEIQKEISHQRNLEKIHSRNIQHIETQIGFVGSIHATIGQLNQLEQSKEEQTKARSKIKELERQLGLIPSATKPTSDVSIRGGKISDEDKMALVAKLASWSTETEPTSAAYFQKLISRADLEDAVKIRGKVGYGGDAEFNALRLVDWALGIGANPKDRNTALGCILAPLLPDLVLEDQTFIAGMIVRYRLLQSQSELNDLNARYQFPEQFMSAPAQAATASIGPTVRWAKETTDLELQGWFTPEPQYLGVALLMKAAQRARSVCRVEVGVKMMGTGILIHRDLILTNYHVLGGDLNAATAVLETNALNTVIRFGAFTAQGGAAAGQEVRLHKRKPVVISSVRYDFVLLRTDSSIDLVADVSPFFDIGLMPVNTNPLYVLQHPGGGPMMLALSSNGVTWVDPGHVTIQYTTKVAVGSSGSPCFDADWNLVALHHAGAGSKGEGILMECIFGEIRQYLNA